MTGLGDALRDWLASWPLLIGWLGVTLVCLAVVIRDLRVHNPHLMPLMKFVWILTTANSGPLGLAVYWYSGRKTIPRDSLPRKAFRSVAHCYSGCGIGEILGVILAVGVLAAGNFWASIITFALAWLFGFGLTVGPMVQAGAPLGEAIRDSFIAETFSIAVMETVAIGVGLWLGGEARLHEALFWTSLYVSLSAGLLAAWPANLLLVRMGVKSGMMDPRDTRHARAPG